MADISLYYTESGEGFPLIFLHGNGEDSGYFVHQTEFFSAYFRTIAIDTRGHGRSPRGEGEFSLVRFADDLHDFMLSHGIEKAHILGFSDGGNIALYFALKYPSMVGRLVLCGANISPSGIKRSVQIPIEIGYSIAKLFAKKSEGARVNAEILGLMVNEPDISPEELSQIKAPTLVIAGTKDMVRRSHTELIAASIPCAELAFINGDHFIANKNPDEFNKRVKEFLCEGQSGG